MKNLITPLKINENTISQEDYERKKTAIIIAKRSAADRYAIPGNYAKADQFLKKMFVWCYDPVRVCEMWKSSDGFVASNSSRINCYLGKYTNTLHQLQIQLTLEFDAAHDLAVKGVCDTILNLMNANQQYAVFYAQYMRSPYIIIFDKELQDLKQIERIKYRKLFWQKHVPIQYQGVIDPSFYNDGQKMPLPFAPHWKYCTPFNLIHEFVPKC